MELVRSWLGVPADGAVETLSVMCAHCNAKLTPTQLDYDCVRARLPDELNRAFAPLERDDATNAFLMRSSRRPYVVNWGASVACSYLRKRMSLTDANAILGRGKMHVLSRAHVEDLLGRKRASNGGGGGDAGCGGGGGGGGVLLDVGAGEGEVTEKLRDGGCFDAVVATEVSPPMVKRLKDKRFDCVIGAADVSGVFDAARNENVKRLSPDGFDAIALLNVLDRCDTPFTLLSQLRGMLRPGVGRLLLAVVIPFRPFVEDGNSNRPPRERLPLPSDGGWDDGVSKLWSLVLKPAGFKIERLARVPYISEGDQKHGAYVLDDAIFVLSPASGDDDDAS